MVKWALTESPGVAPFFASKLSNEINQITDALKQDDVEDLKPKRIFRLTGNCLECLRQGLLDSPEGPVGLFLALLRHPTFATLEQKLEFLIPVSAQTIPGLSEGTVKNELLEEMDEEVERVCRLGLQELEAAGEDFFRMKKELIEGFRRQGKIDLVVVQGIENLKTKIGNLSRGVER